MSSAVQSTEGKLVVGTAVVLKNGFWSTEGLQVFKAMVHFLYHCLLVGKHKKVKTFTHVVPNVFKANFCIFHNFICKEQVNVIEVLSG